jgi:hypothetical protein
MNELNIQEGQQARDAAIKQIDENADMQWKDRALVAVERLCLRRKIVTSDDVWEELGTMDGVHDRRAMGAVMHRARSKGFCKPTDRYRPTANKKSHCSPMRLWRSLICEENCDEQEFEKQSGETLEALCGHA